VFDQLGRQATAMARGGCAPALKQTGRTPPRGPARPLFESRESFLGEGPVRLHGKDGPVGLHEDALGVAAQDEFADL